MSTESARYPEARARYADLGLDTERALTTLAALPLSIHVWQGDDVGGFEPRGGDLSGSGLAVTGAYPGKPRTLEELRADLAFALSLMPGAHKVNLHAIYGEFPEGKPVARDEIGVEAFRGWIDWAKETHVGLDFNATCFAHPLAASGATLSHRDAEIRAFWVRHVRACRTIASEFGKALGTPAIHNLWIPDGTKDLTSRRFAARAHLLESLDAIYAEARPTAHLIDSVESKLFGIGSEAFVAGSHEFYMGYALKRGLHLCLDMGHFHPTESIADKISSLLLYLPGLLLHLSRGLRWDSDHVLILDDALLALTEEVAAADAFGRTAFALDYFDGAQNRVAAWVIGARAARVALLRALLTPLPLIREAEERGETWRALALREEAKALPWAAVWEEFLARNDCPQGAAWMHAVDDYETRVLRPRKEV